MPEFPYRTAELESIPCNLCGGSETEPLNDRDRNGLDVRTCLCTRCGLIFINPRMSHKWYGEYYRVEYRAQMARFKGKAPSGPDHAKMFEGARRHGAALARRFRPHWAPGLTIEVGSSVGGVLDGIREVVGGELLGIEPSPEESAYANSRGIKTYCSLLEDFQEPVPPATNVVCTQSLNHFLDPRSFFAFSNRQLKPGGTLILEVMNFRDVFRRFGWMPRAIQIDHTYMFVPEVLVAFVEAAGFDIVHLESDESKSVREREIDRKAGLPGFHIGLVARKADRVSFDSKVPVKAQYQAVRDSLNAVPQSKFKYLIQHGIRRWRKTGRV